MLASPLRRFSLLLAGLLLATAACEPREAPAPGAPSLPEPAPTTRDEAAVDSMTLYPHFTRDEEPHPVPRPVRIDPRVHPAENALRELLRGPREEERARGFTSFFSEETAGMLRDVRLEAGRLHVDFFDFRDVIPNASSAAGSRALLGELNATAFQFAEVREIDYRIEGSCDAFWNFLQRGCEIVDRTWQF
jgi:spore germination protein GerM